ncbi:MAG TPA: hypothetical protein VEU30_12650, partial [Thermoanaerobaculia bacterium]|nr:hypothetical protein [Thermoanaerobaculia bacterium]
LAKVFQLARIWRCKAGVMDHEFVTASGGDLDQERGITITEVRECIDRVNAVSRRVDLAALETYELKHSSVEDLPMIAY